MSETTPERPAVLGRRGEAECARARTSLAEADALLGLLRYREAVVVATRALRRGADHDDVEARLRVVRGHGLWLTGPASRAQPLIRSTLFLWKRNSMP